MNNDKIRGWLLKVVLAIALGIGGIGSGMANWIPYDEWLYGFDWPYGGDDGYAYYLFSDIQDLSSKVKPNYTWRVIGEAQWTEDFVGGPLQYTTWPVEIQECVSYPGVYYLQPYANIEGYNNTTKIYIDATDPQKVIIGTNGAIGRIGNYNLCGLIQAIPEQIHGKFLDECCIEENYGKLTDNTISFPPGAFWLFACDFVTNKYGTGAVNIRATRRPVYGCGLTIKLPDYDDRPKDYSLKLIDDKLHSGRNAPVPEVLRYYYPWSVVADYGLDIDNIYCKFFPYKISAVTNEIESDVIKTGEKISKDASRRAWFRYNIYEKPSGLYSYVLVATNRNGEIVGKKYASKWWQEYLDILRNEDLRWSNWLPSKVETVTYSDDIFASAYPEKYPYTKPYEVQLRAIKNLPGFLILRDPYTTTRTGLVECQWDYYKERGIFPEGPYDILIDVRNPEKVRIPCCMLGISNGYGEAMIESVEAYNRRMGLPEEGLWGTFKDGQLYFPPGSIYYYESKNLEPRRVNLNDRFNFSVSLKPYVSGIDDVTADEEENIHAPEGIYNLQGVKLSPTADETDINALTPGLYIINGKKTMIRR